MFVLKARYLGIPLLLGAALAGCAQAPPAAPFPWYRSLALGVEAARAQDKPIVLVFDASWCAICRRLKDTTFADSGVREALGAYVPVRIDIEEQPHVARKYHVDAVPQVLILTPDGTEIIRVAGYLDPGEMRGFLAR